MQVRQVTFDLGKPLFPDEARAAAAALLDGFQPGLVRAMMNYEIHEGRQRTITGFPPVHFQGAANGFSLLGFGDDGESLVNDLAPALVQAFSQAAKRIVRAETKTIELALEKSRFPFTYRVPKIVVQKKAEHLSRMKSPEAGKAHLEDLFLRSIMRQAEYAGLHVPSTTKVTFVGAEGEFAAKNGKSPVAHLGLKGARFEVNLRLDGIWTVGYLLSKGYGSFNADLQKMVGTGSLKEAEYVSSF